jgi:hypothetical protein
LALILFVCNYVNASGDRSERIVYLGLFSCSCYLSLIGRVTARDHAQALLLGAGRLMTREERHEFAAVICSRFEWERELPIMGFRSDLGACVFCLEEIGQHDMVAGLPQCGHMFHFACMESWVGKAWQRCPVCRSMPDKLAETRLEAESA